MHYQRLQAHGDPLISGRKSPEQRFWEKVDKNGPTPEHRPELGPCWVWTAATIEEYGYFWLDGDNVRAHRVSCEWERGPIPEGLVVDHLCRNHSCVRPSHLEAVTEQENILRGTGPSAENAAKTHCIHGHAFTPENTKMTPRGGRHCRTCAREWARARRAAVALAN